MSAPQAHGNSTSTLPTGPRVPMDWNPVAVTPPWLIHFRLLLQLESLWWSVILMLNCCVTEVPKQCFLGETILQTNNCRHATVPFRISILNYFSFLFREPKGKLARASTHSRLEERDRAPILWPTALRWPTARHAFSGPLLPSLTQRAGWVPSKHPSLSRNQREFTCLPGFFKAIRRAQHYIVQDKGDICNGSLFYILIIIANACLLNLWNQTN